MSAFNLRRFTFWILIATVAAGGVYYFLADSRQPVGAKSERTGNKYVHVCDNPSAAAYDLEQAWERFQSAQRRVPRTDGKPTGMSDRQIEELEQKMRQRFPADLKAFLKIYLSYGDQLNDLEFLSPDYIYPFWIERTEMGLGMAIWNQVSYDAPSDGEPAFTGPSVLLLASDFEFEIGYDLRNGKVIEVIDADAGWIANSLTELFNEMARHYEDGKIVSRYYSPVEDLPDADRYRTKIFDSVMWHAYEVPPEAEE